MLSQILSQFFLYSALMCSKCLGNIDTYPSTLMPDSHLHEMILKHLLFAERRSWLTITHLCMNGQLSPTCYLYRDGYGLKELFYEETCDNIDKSNMTLGPRDQNNLQSLWRVCFPYSMRFGHSGSQCLASLKWKE